MPDSFMDDKTAKELGKMFKKLDGTVKLVHFTQTPPCPTCKEQRQLLEELVAVSDRLDLEVYDFVGDARKVREYSIDKIPATVLLGEAEGGMKDFGIRFYGVTAGYEFSALVKDILLISSRSVDIRPELVQMVMAIDVPVHIQVMTSLTCPYCPDLVNNVHQMAMLNGNISADAIDVAEFPHLVQKYDVHGVPKAVINEIHSFEGAIPPEAIYMEMLKAVKPEEYGKLEEAIRRASPDYRATDAEEDHVYEVLIVGAGPAALSAAVYAARKDLDIAVIGERVGGQVYYTAQVDNYLGFPEMDGRRMIELFRKHAERYPIAQAFGSRVALANKQKKNFAVLTEDGRTYVGRSLIFCGGKEYKRLGVPGEEKFLGRGVAFCATCDAPLYTGKRVAVVGGGNSAFTAVRDLVSFADHVHLVHRRKDFTADSALQKEVKKAKNVTLHTPYVVQEFLGKDRLQGVRLLSEDGTDRTDLPVEGVFLEIGMVPRTEPVRDLIELNEWGEIPVGRDQETEVPGLFAAGDAADCRDKQICVAVGDGAKAALSAHRYLTESGLTRSRVSVKETWQ